MEKDAVYGPYKDRKRWRVIYQIGGQTDRRFYACEREARIAANAAREEIETANQLWEKARELQRIADKAILAAARADRRGLTVELAIERYVEDRRKAGCKPRTLETLRLQLRGILAPALDEPVRGITVSRARKLYMARTGQVAVATHQKERAQAGTLWRWLGKQRIATGNAWEEVEPVGKANRGKLQLHEDEARKIRDLAFELLDVPAPSFLQRVRAKGALAVVLGLESGLRASEIVGLKARDVSDGGHVLWVAEDGDGKSEAARRRVLIDDPLAGFLAARASEVHAEKGAFGRVFPHHRDWVRKRTLWLCERAEVPLICAHGLRGTHATLGTEAGESARAIAATLGHASPAITARHYTRPGATKAAQQERTMRVLKGGER